MAAPFSRSVAHATIAAVALGLLASRPATARDLRLGYLYYQSGPSAVAMIDSWVQESFSQFKLAIQDVNANASVLPNDTITFVLADTAALETVAIRGIVSLLDAGVVGIVGTGYSSALGLPAGYASMEMTPIVSPGSTSAVHIDKTRYPFLLRSIANDASQLKAMAVIAADFAWERAVVLVNLDLEHGCSMVLRPALESLGVSFLLLAYETPANQVQKRKYVSLLELVKDSGYRVLFLYPLTVDMQFWNLASLSAGLRSLKYIWIVSMSGYHGLAFMKQTVNVIFPEFVEDSGTGADQRRKDYIRRWPNVSTLWNGSVHGFFNATTKLPFFGGNAQSPTIWDTDYAAVGDGQPDMWGMYVYDTVWLFALAIDSLQRMGADPFDGTRLRDQLLQTRFQGVTGNIIFDEDTQDRMVPVSMFLTQNGSAPHLIARTTPELGRGSPQDGPGSWCASSCTDLKPDSRAAIPWTAGSEPTDGRALDVAESSVFAGASYVDGRLIEVIVQVRDSFKGPPCREHCMPAVGDACAQCLASFAAYDDVLLNFTDAETGQRLLPAVAPNRTVDVASGRLSVALPRGISGAVVVGQRQVELVVSYQGEVLATNTHRIRLTSPDVRVCGDGQGYDVSVQACVPCPAGSFSKDRDCRTGLPCGCQKCELGRFSQGSGMSLCESCLSGSFAGSEGLTACQNCTPGTASAEVRAFGCAQCERGFFSDAFGRTSCSGCPKGTYSRAMGQPACTPCPLTFTTDSRASTVPGDCQCAPGSRLVRAAGAEPRCQACTDGLVCDGFGSLPRLAKGFYVPPGAALDAPNVDLYRCMSKVACPGQSSATDPPCAPRSIGLNCGRCEAGAFLAGSACKPCEDVHVLPFAVIALVLLSGGYLYFQSFRMNRTRVIEKVLAPITFGIALTFVQVLGIFDSIELAWPSQLRWFFSHSKILLFDLSFLRLDCSGEQSLATAYLMPLCVPLVITTVFMSWWLISRPLHWATRGRMPILCFSLVSNGLGSVTQALFISMVKSTLSLVECYDNPNGVKTLRSYPYAVCGYAEQHALIPVFVLGILVYVVCVFAVFFWVLYVAPLRVTDDAFKISTRALVYKFHVGKWWFGLHLLIRSACVALVTVIEPSNGHVQFYLLVTVLGLGLLVHVLCLPYADRYANILETTQLALLLLCLILASWFLDDRDVNGADARMAGALTGLLIALVACCFVVLFAAIVLALCQEAFPAKALAKQQAKARRAAMQLSSACEVALGADETVLQSMLMHASYTDLITIQKFANLVMLELCGLQAAERSMRRLPRWSKDVKLRSESDVAEHRLSARKLLVMKLQANATWECRMIPSHEFLGLPPMKRYI